MELHKASDSSLSHTAEDAPPLAGPVFCNKLSYPGFHSKELLANSQCLIYITIILQWLILAKLLKQLFVN